LTSISWAIGRLFGGLDSIGGLEPLRSGHGHGHGQGHG